MALGYAETSKIAHWLLDVEIGGVMYRFASSALKVETLGGELLEYQGGLDIPSVARVQDGAAEASTSISISSQDDWALFEARGHTLDRAPGILRRWWEGTKLERAVVYLRGITTDVSYSSIGDPIQFNLVRSPSLVSRDILDAQNVVNAYTWPVRSPGYDYETKIEGAFYQLPIGCPGHTGGVPEAAVPALMTEFKAGTTSTGFLLSVGHIQATKARVWNYVFNPPTSEDVNVIHSVDKLGRDVSYATFAGFGVWNASADPYWYGLQADASYGGGPPNPYRPNTYLRGAGDVLRWVLSEYTNIKVDHAMMVTYADWLNRFHVDTYINKQVDAWKWVNTSILSWLPVVARETERGMYFQPVRWDYTAEDVVAYLSVERGDITRAGRITRLSQEIYNEISINYRPRPSGGKWFATRTLTSNKGTLSVSPTITDDNRVLSSYTATWSQSRYGVRPLTVDLEHTWSETTADLVASMLMQRHAVPKRVVTYTAPSEFEALEPGSAIAITDAELYLTDAIAYVVDVVPVGNTVRLDLILLDNPTQNTSVL